MLTTITIDSVDYSSYATVTEADEVLNIDITRGTAWKALDTDGKGARLIAATRRLDLLRWDGEKTGGNAQTTAFPRSGLLYPDGEEVDDSTVPIQVELATIYMAGSIAVRPANASSTSTTSTSREISKVKAGPVEIQYSPGSSGASNEFALPDIDALTLITFWLVGNSQSLILSNAYGIDAESFFVKDRYKRSEGFS